ncbi:MAG: MBL fold metallo-hydrolase [Desulfobacteraceae bacterium]|nr:MBL fold metallo-hydrolase [Desulfobacteraceae bacterium]
MLWGRGGRRKDAESIIVRRFVSPLSQRNQYLLIDGEESAVIDLDDAIDDVKSALEANGAHLCHILATHGHSSCVQSVPTIRKRLGGKFLIHEFDEELLERLDPPLIPDGLLKDNMTLALGSFKIRVLHTPGHTKGSVCFWIRQCGALFTGNTLLKGQQGRIWGPKSMSLMLFSLKRIGYTVPEETRVYPGRGEETSIREEGWIQCLRSA